MDFGTSSNNKKNGLIYKDDFKTIIGVDEASGLFTGRVPFGAHAITSEVFSNSPYESISLPDSLEVLGECLFENSPNLQKVKLPYDIKSLPAYLFSGCTALSLVTMPAQLSEYPEGLFYNCTSLKEIVLRPGISTIPENCFAGCRALMSVVIPDYIKNIGKNAFAGCTSLSTVIIPSSIMDISPDAFENCPNITSVRLLGESAIYFIDPKDNCLYERTANGDELIIKVAQVQKQEVSFFEENEEALPEETFFENEEVSEIDETFSSEVQADSEEMSAVLGSEPIMEPAADMIQENNDEIQMSQEEEQSIMSDSFIPETQTENSMDTVIENNVDSMLADIMNDERSRTENVSTSVAVDEKETQILTEMMDVMNEKSESENTGRVTEDELARLFSKNESTEPAGEDAVQAQKSADEVDSKTQILLSSVSFSKVIECTPEGELPSDPELFVIAEKTVTGADGAVAFSSKLVKTARTFAHIQDFKRIILLNGLPVENDEFMQFYHHFIAQRHVVFACEASSPAKLSEYGKTVCEESRISLDRDDLISQRKKISIKNNTLIKLVIQDKYED